VPTAAEWDRLGLLTDEPLAVGLLDGTEAWAAGLPTDAEPPEGMAFLGLRRLWGVLDEAAWKLAGRAAQIVEWDRDHRYCGRCGAGTARKPGELARLCPHCGLQHFPRISPAVIVRIERGDEILLARSPHFAPGVYSTIAGFVEPGESLEQTVAREVREEVGVEVTNVRYFGSQPWPFPHSLMIGFVADWASGEIRLQEEEIEDAGWFRVDALPGLPSRLSIARALVDDFIASQGLRA
jgi:NAD+ diphosphatase